MGPLAPFCPTPHISHTLRHTHQTLCSLGCGWGGQELPPHTLSIPGLTQLISRGLLVPALIFIHSIPEFRPVFSFPRDPPTSSWESSRGQCGLKNVLIPAPKL